MPGERDRLVKVVFPELHEMIEECGGQTIEAGGDSSEVGRQVN